MDFRPIRDVDAIAQNILEKRYLKPDETSWNDVVHRVMNYLYKPDEFNYPYTYMMLQNRYFLPNSPCLVNAGTKNGGLSACFVVDFPDDIYGIYKTKLDFALIAKKGGGCGTTLSKIRPENSRVEGSSHGYAGGPIKFFDTICHDMEAMTQSGFREMAMMGTMSIYHPDILKFITSKTIEGKMRTTNISVVVDNLFMEKVINDQYYETVFDGIIYEKLKARDVYNLIVDGAWKNGEPGIIFDDKVNDSPYKETGQYIYATNPCGEQGLPANGVCNLGSIDISKFIRNGDINLELFESAIRLGVRFLDRVIDLNKFPTEDIDKWAKSNRPIGLGLMGIADALLNLGITYGDQRSISLLNHILEFMKTVVYDESEKLGQQFGIPNECKKLKIPRRNITLLSIAPTGTISLLAGCSNGIEPIFSELTRRVDRTGTYEINHEHSNKKYFRCAVSSNGQNEVTWKEHIDIQNIVQKWVDSGVSKTINFPNSASRQDIYDSFLYAYKLGNIKGLTVYRNGSRSIEVLSPQKINDDKCPICGKNLIKESGCKHCIECEFSVCEIG